MSANPYLEDVAARVHEVASENMFLKEALRKVTRERWIWWASGLMLGFIGCGLLFVN